MNENTGCKISKDGDQYSQGLNVRVSPQQRYKKKRQITISRLRSLSVRNVPIVIATIHAKYLYSVYQKTFTLTKRLLMQKAFNVFNKVLYNYE